MGAQDEYCYDNVAGVIELLKTHKNPKVDMIFTVIPDADHGLHGKYDVVANAVAAAADRGRKQPEIAPEDSHRYSKIEPALAPTITRKLLHVIPANLQIDTRWDAIRDARDAAKTKNGKHAPSPSVMIA